MHAYGTPEIEAGLIQSQSGLQSKTLSQKTKRSTQTRITWDVWKVKHKNWGPCSNYSGVSWLERTTIFKVYFRIYLTVYVWRVLGIKLGSPGRAASSLNHSAIPLTQFLHIFIFIICAEVWRQSSGVGFVLDSGSLELDSGHQAKIQLWSSYEIILWLGSSQYEDLSELKAHSIRKVRITALGHFAQHLKKESLFSHILFVLCVGAKDSQWESVLSFHPVGTQVVGSFTHWPVAPARLLPPCLLCCFPDRSLYIAPKSWFFYFLLPRGSTCEHHHIQLLERSLREKSEHLIHVAKRGRSQIQK